MEEQNIRTAIDRHWAASAAGDQVAEHEIYHEDAVCEYPQSGEVIRGRSNLQALRSHHPGKPSGFAVRRIVGTGNLWVTEYVINYQGKRAYTVSMMEFRDGKVAHETQYFADPFDAPAWRAQWVEMARMKDESGARHFLTRRAIKALFSILASLLVGTLTLAADGNDELKRDVKREDIERHVQEALKQKAPLPNGQLVVPNAAVAEAIHVAVAGAVYGKDSIEGERPFHAVRSGEFWVVYGYMPPEMVGGVAVTVIRASNGEVIWVMSGE